MLVSLSWLNDYVDVADKTPAELAAILTDLGLEVESIQGGATIPPEVVVGKVLTAVKHPNADALRLCTVDVGAGTPLNIVCGAANAREGILVVVAQVGAVLPGDFKIKKSKIRGETSEGMLCSMQELGMAEESEGILELPGSPRIGSSAAKALGLEEIVLELGVTPNRADCLGLLGVARDLAAKLKRPLKEPEMTTARDGGTQTEGRIAVKVADPALCARFVALSVTNASAGPSPRWMQKRLEASGMRPINLIVDATNYVLMEYGQPVHAYDARFIRGNVIEVRAAAAGEVLKTLDGQERKLEAGDILICDGSGPIGLAGVMGGASSEVRSDTTELVIEVASFAPLTVRKTSRRLALHTEASHRFERGTDVDALERVALRVAALIAQGAKDTKAATPKIAKDAIDTYPGDVQKRVVALRLGHTKQFLGLPQLAKEEAKGALEGLGFEMLDATDDRMVFEVPYWRGDIEREVDLIEEIARVCGYDKIPYQMPVMNIRPTPEDPFIEFQEQARTALAESGFNETVTFPFIATIELDAMGIGAGHPLFPTLTLANPLSGPYAMMQTTLIPGLLRGLAGNRKQGERGVRLFECGRGYFDFSAKTLDQAGHPMWRHLARPGRHLGMRAKLDPKRPTERHWIAAAIDQPFLQKSWNTTATVATFYHGKSAVSALMKAFGIDGWTLAPVVAKDVPFLHPGASAIVMLGNRAAGYVGELHPRTATALDLGADQPPIILELDLEMVFDAKGKGAKLDTDLKRFPPATRDLAFLVGRDKTHAHFVDAIKAFKGKKHLGTYKLFDVYEGKNLETGKKSMAYSFAFQSPERTLTDQEVDAEVQQLVQWLGQNLEAQQR